MFKELEQLGLNIDDKISENLKEFTQLFLEYNEKVNLISKNDSKYLFEKHIYDSLSLNLFFKNFPDCFNNTRNDEYFEHSLKLLDIGTGGGFPSIPLAICFDNIEVTAIDSTFKKIKFIEYIKEKLNLKNLHPVCNRIELTDFKPEYDICVSRALSELRVILEYGVPYLKEGSFFVGYKSLKADEEIIQAKNALKQLNSEVIDKIEYNLPIEEKTKRTLVVVKKISKTPAIYPRKNGIILKKPL